jgi:hypothetical protein
MPPSAARAAGSSVDDSAADAADGVPDAVPGRALFEGDTGELAIDTRRVLVSLITGPYLDGQRQTKLWPVLLRDEPVLRRRLSEMFLDLVIDTETKVAFIRRADTGDLEVPVMLRQRKLTFIDSLLVLFLRQHLMQSAAKGERAVVSLAEISEHLSLYQNSGSLDKAGFSKRINAAVKRATNYNLLQRIRGSEGRFEVSPTLRILFTAEQVSQLVELYTRLRDGGMALAETEEGADAPDDDDPEEDA